MCGGLCHAQQELLYLFHQDGNCDLETLKAFV